jgi:outer membrane protein, adhesin transport system
VARKVDEATRLAWHELETARQRVELLQNAVAIASEVFDARHKLREAGRETVINVLDAENEVYNANINLVEAEGDARLAAYRVLQGMGRLGPAELGVSVE